jgi:hypothetical protein
MSSRQNEILADALELLHLHGIIPQVEHSKHCKIKFVDAAGKNQMLVVSRSPSTVFARRKSLGVLRRLLRRTA